MTNVSPLCRAAPPLPSESVRTTEGLGRGNRRDKGSLMIWKVDNRLSQVIVELVGVALAKRNFFDKFALSYLCGSKWFVLRLQTVLHSAVSAFVVKIAVFCRKSLLKI